MFDGRKDGHGSWSFDDRPDRVTGARGNAVILSSEGELVVVLRGDEDTAQFIAESYTSGKLTAGGKYTTLKTDDGTYAVTLSEDPVIKNAYIASFIDITAITGLASRMNIILIIVIAAAIILCVILSRVFAKQLSKPVQCLSDYAHDIGEGDLEPREMDFKEEEFSGLADSMNRMAAALKESKSRQEVFFQNVSHELRTPLTSIKGNAEGIVYGVMDRRRRGRPSSAKRTGSRPWSRIFFISPAWKRRAARRTRSLSTLGTCFPSAFPNRERRRTSGA